MHRDEYLYRRRSIKAWKFIKNRTTEKREIMPIPAILHKEWMNHYRKLLTEELLTEYKISQMQQTHSYRRRRIQHWMERIWTER